MISFIVPTVGRPSLHATLRSIELWAGDEVVLVGDCRTVDFKQFPSVESRQFQYVHCSPGRDWGHTERNVATPCARRKYIAHIDDDDTYAPGTRALMADAIEKTPDRPILFRMRYPNGITLWSDEQVRCGNVGTPMMLIPNQPSMLGTWGSFVGGDCHFLETSKWKAEDYVWRSEVIAHLGHNT